MAPTSETSPTAGETSGDSGRVLTDAEAAAQTPAEKKSAAAAQKAAKGDEADTVVVEFTGVPPYGREFTGQRIIPVSDMKRREIDYDGPDLVWSAVNGWRVRVPADNEMLLESFREKDSGFRVRDDT